jgi:hypothetical protein
MKISAQTGRRRRLQGSPRAHGGIPSICCPLPILHESKSENAPPESSRSPALAPLRNFRTVTLRLPVLRRPGAERSFVAELLIANPELEFPATHRIQSTATKSNRERIAISQFDFSVLVTHHLPLLRGFLTATLDLQDFTQLAQNAPLSKILTATKHGFRVRRGGTPFPEFQLPLLLPASLLPASLLPCLNALLPLASHATIWVHTSR